ncbi:MAG TPA: YciC family protein [bacterium]|nr:YciC family protein [bacterium]
MQKTKLISLRTGIKNAFQKITENSALGFGIKGYLTGTMVLMAIAIPLGILLLILGGILNPSYKPSAQNITRQSFGTEPRNVEEILTAEPNQDLEGDDASFLELPENLVIEGNGSEEESTTQIMEEEQQSQDDSDWTPEDIAELYNNTTEEQVLLAPNPTTTDSVDVYPMPTAKPEPSIAIIIVFCILILITLAFYGTLVTLIPIKMHTQEFVPMKDLLKEALRKAPKYFGLTMIMGVIVGLGYVLLVIPGIILTISFMFAPYILLKEDVGIFEALRQSKRLTKGYKWALFGRGIRFTIGMFVLILPMLLAVYAVGPLLTAMFGFFTILLLMEFYDDLKSKQALNESENPTKKGDDPSVAETDENGEVIAETNSNKELPDLPELPNVKDVEVNLPDLPEPEKGKAADELKGFGEEFGELQNPENITSLN